MRLGGLVLGFLTMTAVACAPAQTQPQPVVPTQQEAVRPPVAWLTSAEIPVGYADPWGIVPRKEIDDPWGAEAPKPVQQTWGTPDVEPPHTRLLPMEDAFGNPMHL
jgi:hypothetical protein